MAYRVTAGTITKGDRTYKVGDLIELSAEQAGALKGQVEAAPDLPAADAAPPALVLINGAQQADEIITIKGIGISGAKILLEKRPPLGYESIGQAAEASPELAKAPYNVKWGQVAQWEPSNGDR